MSTGAGGTGGAAAGSGGSSSGGAGSAGASGTPSDGGASSLVGSINQARKLHREFRKMHETVKNIGKTLDEIFEKTYRLKVDTSAINQVNPDDTTTRTRGGFTPQIAYKNSNKGLFLQPSLISFNKGFLLKPVPVPLTANTQPIANQITGLSRLAQNVGRMLAQGIKLAVGSAMDLEQQMISIQHIVGDTQANGAAGDASTEYINKLRELGSSGPFSTDEMMKAGMDAIKITGGDTQAAKDMLEAAQNIAALNPGKTVGDAVNALQELKSGKADALTDFGFTASKGSVKSATNGDFSKVVNEKGKSLNTTFAGGKDKYAQTGKGMANTLKNSLTAGLQDAGIEMLAAIKPGLSQLITLVQGFRPVFQTLGAFAGAGISAVVRHLTAFVTWIQPKMPEIINGIQTTVGQVSATMGPIFEQLMSLFKNVFQWVYDNMPIFKDALGSVFTTVAPLISGVMDVFQSLWKAWEEAWPTIQTILTKAWETMQPIFTFLQDALRLAAFVIEDQFKPAIDMLWSVFEPLLEAIKNTMSWLGDRFGNLVDWITGETTPPQDRKDPQAKPHAAGLRTVPRDNYPALLHRNEAVLTAQEANQYRNGRFGGRGVTINLNHPVAREEADFAKWAQVLRAELEGAVVNMA
ncbi:phage tail protein [Paenibacillus arenosi]|uniref:Phage tail tape measure protein n=1 Tax=Paenibacillus arenosi TaxID=2774142 RepID=A0ABR9B2Z1_9BACL|nr:hypothetical protein [Paenibacillus arenosi]MBD8500743.1 hypothetical protein [Paenibacillus arenosi]